MGSASLPDDIRDYWKRNLKVTQGTGVGQTFEPLPYLERSVDLVYGERGDVTEFGLSMARSNGKTTSAAALACLYADPDGPLAEPRSEILCIASRYQQALSLVRHIAAFLAPKIELAPSRWRVLDNDRNASIHNRQADIRVKALAAKAGAAHGLAGVLWLVDEPAQQLISESPRIYAAVQTGLGKFDGAMAMFLGTRSDSDTHWFNRGLAGGFDQALSYHVDAGADLNEINHRLANPGWDYLPPVRRTVLKAARRAAADPTFRPTFDSLHHNSGTPDVGRDMPLALEHHQRVERELDDMPPRQGPYALGIDLAANAGMCGAAAHWWQSGRTEILGAFPQHPGLRQRGASDGVGDLYVECAREGDLVGLGRRVVPYGRFLALCFERFGGMPEVLLCDNYNRSLFLEAVADVGFPLERIHLRKMGWIDGAEDLSRFRDSAYDDRIRLPKSKLMRMTAAAGIAIGNAAGAWKLARAAQAAHQVQRGRDDVLAATILAIAEGSRRRALEPQQLEYVAGSFF
ncbi:MAG: hypothetical protein F4037_13400 [Gemmatimonadales bacterium]|nr:hypothetical protein [Candidatus Palauibacter ramosifaciens]